MSEFPSAQEVILAAVGSLGPVDDADLPVKTAVRVADILALLGDESEARQVYGGLARVYEGLAAAKAAGQKTSPNGKIIYGWVESVEEEESSHRVKLTLITKPHPEHNPDGRDKIRSERLESSYARALGNKAHRLRGHNVAVIVEIQSYKDKSDGKTKHLRVFWDIIDRGVAERPDYQVARAA